MGHLRQRQKKSTDDENHDFIFFDHSILDKSFPSFKVITKQYIFLLIGQFQNLYLTCHM